MSKLFFCNTLAVIVLALPFAALADVTGTQTLQSGSTLSLDTGTVATSGGDILWNGTTLAPQGSATAIDVTSLLGAETPSFSSISSTELTTLAQSFGSLLSQTAITPAVNDIIIAKTNGGNYAKILVNTVGSSISLQFDTFTSSSGTTSSGPNITALQNNYSGIQPGFPSYGIAPASLFIIYGTGLSAAGTPVLQSLSAPLPLTLNQTSISVTVAGKTTTPAIYYTSPTQVAAVLPSTTPVGSGTITVTYNGTASAPATILVTKSAFGIDTLYGAGSGGIVATVGSSVIVPTASAGSGQVITIWGTGLGADTANDDRTYPLKQDNLNDAQVYIGGISANVTYAGRSQYPGVDQIDVVVPSVSGCGISVVVVANGLASNFGTLPVNAGGGVCADPTLGITGSEIGIIGSQGTVRSGSVSLIQDTSPSAASFSLLKNAAHAKPALPAKPAAQSLTTSYYATADFSSDTGASVVTGTSFVSLGSCIVSQDISSTSTGTVTSNGLDAGTPITLSGGGQSVSLPETDITGLGVGTYFANLTTPLVGGSAYTFTGPGGHDVGPFTATVNFPVPLTWTNEGSITTITESQGQQITWSGGASGTYVYISGSSSSSGTDALSPVSGSFICLAPVSAQQFTIPSYVLLALPTGTGGLGVFNFSTAGKFTATGLDYGSASAGVLSEEDVTYQ